MIHALLTSLAVAEGVRPVPGAAPPGVLSRQLPRLLVTLLNGDADRAVRYMPFVGSQDGRRCFLRLSELLPIDTVRRLLGDAAPPELLVDGVLRQEALQLRITQVDSVRVLFDEDLPFDPRHPQSMLQRALFEVTGALGWSGPMPSLPELDGEALGWFLCAQDELLALEAELPSDGRTPLTPLRKVLALAPDSDAVREVLLDICVLMARQRRSLELIGETVWQAAGSADRATDFLFDAAELLEVCGRRGRARELYSRITRLRPDHHRAAARAAQLDFASGDYPRARRTLESCIENAGRRPGLIARLAAVADRTGDAGRRDRLFGELLEAPDLPPEVARLVIGYLLGERRYPEARRIADRTLAAHPDRAELLLERARASLLGGDGVAARADLRGCLEREPARAVRNEVQRLLPFASRPEVLGQMMAVERALQEGDATAALRRCRRVVAANKSMAETWLLLGTVHHKLRNRRRAIRALRRALRIQPRLGEAHNRLGILLVSRGRYREGYRHLIRASGELPGDPAPRIHLAQACHFLGSQDEGRRYLEEARRLGGDPALIDRVQRKFFA